MKQLREMLQPLIGLVLIVVVLVIFAPTFRQWIAVKDVLEQSTVLMIMATGTTIMLISGGLDLSVGSILALVSVTTGTLLITDGVPVWVAVLGGLAAGTVVGLINGLVITITKIPTLIATLGMMMAARGVANMIGAGKDMSRFPDSFSWLGAGFAGPVIITILMVLLTWFILTKLKVGFNAYAIGGNEEVARLSGIAINRNKLFIYAFSGFAAALASIVQTSRLDFAHTNRGQGMELWVIAATVLGGTSMFGGVGGVWGTVIGVLIIRLLQAGLIHLHVESFWQQVAIGVVIIVAVAIDTYQRRERA
jgi:ribose/xylose/arabinose/galactoside ABC-type transport system permease subunit